MRATPSLHDRFCGAGIQPHQKKHPEARVLCVLVKGFEPPRFPRLILSQMRMPFRHTSEQKILYHKPGWIARGKPGEGGLLFAEILQKK